MVIGTGFPRGKEKTSLLTNPFNPSNLGAGRSPFCEGSPTPRSDESAGTTVVTPFLPAKK